MKDYKSIDAVIAGLALITCIFSSFYFHDQLPADWHPFIRAGMALNIAIILTKVWHLAYTYKLKIQTGSEWWLWMFIAAISGTTVFGTVSTFHKEVIKRTMNSQEYQNLQRERETLQKKYDWQIDHDWITKSEDTENLIADIDRKMALIRSHGAGEENSVYTAIAHATGWDVERIALIRLLYLAILIDSSLLMLMFIREKLHDNNLLKKEIQQLRGDTKKKLSTEAQSTNTGNEGFKSKLDRWWNGSPVLDAPDGAMPLKLDSEQNTTTPPQKNEGGVRGGSLNAANSKIERNRMKRTLMAAEVLLAMPDCSNMELAESIGVSSRSTAGKYRLEIEQHGGPEGFREHYDKWKKNYYNQYGVLP